MEKCLYVANELKKLYTAQCDRSMDEMKMHKLMYFAQRESLMLYDEVLFDESFYGWKYGPVLKSVRNEYMKPLPFVSVKGNVSERTKELLQSVLDRYGKLSSWKLSCLSHEEFSWKKSRMGLNSSEDGDAELLLEAMKVDAVREASRRRAATT